MISVETPRLLHRLPEETDSEPFLIIHQDPEVIEKKQVTLTAANRWNRGRRAEREADARAAFNGTWQTTDIPHIISLIAPDDLRSIRVVTKIGERLICRRPFR